MNLRCDVGFRTASLEDSYRSSGSLRSELALIRALLKQSKRCLCPKLKNHAVELHTRKVELSDELKIRSTEEPVDGV